MTPSVKPAQHFSLDAEGNEVVDLSFVSEPLGMPASDGYGWPQLEFGECIGPGNRYKIARKLGWGMHSSTWLARDACEGKYLALKVLTGHVTRMYDDGLVWEPHILRAVSKPPTSPHCTPLLDEFTIPGKGSSGSHRCFSLPLYGGDVDALRRSRTTPFPLPLAKRIALHVVRGLARVHERGVVHTDVKLNNVFYETKLAVSDLDALVAANPPRRHAPELSVDGTLQAAASQPLPAISEEAALRATYVLGDYGNAELAAVHGDHEISAPPFRPPEAYLGGRWGKPADIWSYGCLVYTLIVSQQLFSYEINDKLNLTETENMLYQMMLYSGEIFHPKQLGVSPGAAEFFSPDGQLKKEPEIFHSPLEMRFVANGALPPEQAELAANFIRRCLRLDPGTRATAAQLQEDTWFGDAA